MDEKEIKPLEDIVQPVEQKVSYQSVDKLQKLLATTVFNHTKDPKKAAGRALGTLVEVITSYLLKTWGLNNQISIEQRLEEYGNSFISHNSRILASSDYSEFYSEFSKNRK